MRGDRLRSLLLLLLCLWPTGDGEDRLLRCDGDLDECRPISQFLPLPVHKNRNFIPNSIRLGFMTIIMKIKYSIFILQFNNKYKYAVEEQKEVKRHFPMATDVSRLTLLLSKTTPTNSGSRASIFPTLSSSTSLSFYGGRNTVGVRLRRRRLGVVCQTVGTHSESGVAAGIKSGQDRFQKVFLMIFCSLGCGLIF